MTTRDLVFKLKFSQISLTPVDVPDECGPTVNLELSLPPKRVETNEANLSESDVFWSDTHYLEYLIKISIPHGLPNDKRHEYVREKLESVYLNIIANTWKHKCCIRKDVNLGKGVLDLYTLATGPPKYSQIPLICTTRHEAATRHIAARVRFHCDTQQVLRTTLSVVHLDLSTLEPYMECTYSNIGVKYRFVSPYNSTRSETDSIWGGTTSRYLGDMELAADYQELTEGVVVISVCYGENQEWDTNNIIATTEVSVKDFVVPWTIYTWFQAELKSSLTGGVFGPVSGQIHSTNRLDFAPMPSGEYCHTSGTIFGGSYADDKVPFKPRHAVSDS